jgi:uncharacterized cupin superfamily protein
MGNPVLNIDDAKYVDLGERARAMGAEMPAQRFGGRIAQLGALVGAKKLGYNVTVVAPRKSAFPFHCHRLNEEMFFVIEGRGEVRVGQEVYPIRAGDVIACLPGGPEAAHQIVNTGDAELKVLAVSTMQHPEVCHYPDSGKFAVYDGVGPGGLRFIGRLEDGVGYWDGE